MQYLLNKIVGGICNPTMIGALLLLIAFSFWLRAKRRPALIFQIIALVWLYLFSAPWFSQLLGTSLEEEFPPQHANAMPKADAIVILGGGISANPKILPYPELQISADRVWHAARLYHAGKGKKIITSGLGERNGSYLFLQDLGVPEKDILVENHSKNTEENALFVRRLLEKENGKTILLVTSSWHMRRSLLNFRHFGISVIPAATDYIALGHPPISLKDLLPNGETINLSTIFFKEHLGYWLYRIKFWMFREKEHTK